MTTFLKIVGVHLKKIGTERVYMNCPIEEVASFKTLPDLMACLVHIGAFFC